MADPALLALIQHFANPPPAIVQPAIIADAEPFLSAYEAIADDQDRHLETWLELEAKFREKASLSVRLNPEGFSPSIFDDLIGPMEAHMVRQQKLRGRVDRRMARVGASARLQNIQKRTVVRQDRLYKAADELVLFLRAMRAEVDPKSRGGPTFDNAADFERYFMDAVA